MTLTSKNFYYARSNHLGIKDLAKKYNLTTAEVEDQLQKAFNGNPREHSNLLADLRRNDKRHERQEAKKVTKQQVEATIEKDDESELKKLQKEEQIQSKRVIDLETAHKDKAKSHRDCLKKIRDIQEKIGQLKTEVAAVLADYEAATTENNAFVAQMNAISAQHREEVSKLETIRARIDEMTRSVIFVYANGDITIDDKIVENTDKEETNKIFNVITNNVTFEDLSIKEAKILAKVVVVVAGINRSIEYIFDNPKLEHAFELFLFTSVGTGNTSADTSDPTPSAKSA